MGTGTKTLPVVLLAFGLLDELEAELLLS